MTQNKYFKQSKVRDVCEEIIQQQYDGLVIIRKLAAVGLQPVIKIILNFFCHQDVRKLNLPVLDAGITHEDYDKKKTTVMRLCFTKKAMHNQFIITSVNTICNLSKLDTSFGKRLYPHVRVKISIYSEQNEKCFHLIRSSIPDREIVTSIRASLPI